MKKSFIQIRRQAFGKNFTTSTMTDTHKTTQWQLRTIWWQRKPIYTRKNTTVLPFIYLLGIREWKREIYYKANSGIKNNKKIVRLSIFISFLYISESSLTLYLDDKRLSVKIWYDQKVFDFFQQIAIMKKYFEYIGIVFLFCFIMSISLVKHIPSKVFTFSAINNIM